MIRTILRKIFLFIGIAILFPVIYLIYSNFSYSILGFRDGVASAVSWNDTNANGVREDTENPLPGVCVWGGYTPGGELRTLGYPCQFEGYPLTDKDGRWSEFLPGGSCKQYYVNAIAPDGYQPTTNLASDGCSAEFGFVENGVIVNQRVLSIDEYGKRENTIIWIKRIGIGLLIVVIAIFGTIWLEKKKKIKFV